MYPGTTPRPIRSAIVRTPVAQGLQAAPPLIHPRAYQTRHRPRPRAIHPPGQSVFAGRFAGARERLGRMVDDTMDALREVQPHQQAEQARIDAMVQVAQDSRAPVVQLQREFAAAGRPVDESTAYYLMVAAHDEEVARSVLRADTVMRYENAVPVLDANGRVVTVDVSDDPAVLRAQQAARNSAWRPPTGTSPLVAAQVAPTPAQNAAAAVFGQAVPSPQTVLAEQAAAGPTVHPVVVVGLMALAYYFLKGR